MFDRRRADDVSPAESARPADWLTGRLLAWNEEVGTRVASIVPTGFETYARLFHPATAPGAQIAAVPWHFVAEWSGAVAHPEMQWEAISTPLNDRGSQPWSRDPDIGRCPPEVLIPLQDTLGRHTTTPQEIYLALWLGFADVQAIADKAPRFELPGREYILLRAPLRAVSSVIESPMRIYTTPNLWWPADRAWCVATEVDFRWTYVAASESCISSLERQDSLEILRTLPQHRADLDGDRVNNAAQP